MNNIDALIMTIWIIGAINFLILLPKIIAFFVFLPSTLIIASYITPEIVFFKFLKAIWILSQNPEILQEAINKYNNKEKISFDDLTNDDDDDDGEIAIYQNDLMKI